ncbi:MAG: hypothetical protein LW854_13845 [Rubrivivax sp.]|jgi:hypothetical protein|nr:hypothetical protein [Rubrivivax sp.]
MHQYLLLLHEKPGTFASTSPAEMAEIAQRDKAWAGDLAQRGLLAGGETLADDGGRHLRRREGQALATDGSYLGPQGWVEIRRIELGGHPPGTCKPGWPPNMPWC